ncbi:MAG: LmbE family protein, partial [Bacteroidota bacterium]
KNADKTRLFPVDVGIFYPIRGKSNTEISAESRSMHRTQGFGSVGSRGSSTDYLELIKGDLPTDKSDLFEGVNTTWGRLEGGEPIGEMVKQLDKDFKYDNPAASVPALVEIYKKINALPDGYWKNVKLEETQTLIEATAGLFMEGIAGDFSATAGQELEITIEVIKRSNVNAMVKNIHILPMGVDTVLNAVLEDN